MTIHETDFYFNGKCSEAFGIIMCRFSNSPTSSNDEESEIITSKTYASDIFHLQSIEASAPLKFSFTICKKDGDQNERYFTAEEQRGIKKWLCRLDGYHPLQIEQDDIRDIRYNCVITFGEMVDIGAKNAGMIFNVQCNSAFPYSIETPKTLNCTSGTLSFNLFVDSDFAEADKVIYPTVIITSNTNGTIKITNLTTNEEMKFDNCVVGEVITVSDTEMPSTTIANKIIIDNWNYNSIYFIDGTNKIQITGNCFVKFVYSSPRRVGG